MDNLTCSIERQYRGQPANYSNKGAIKMPIEVGVEYPKKLAGGASGAIIVSYTHKSDGGNGYKPHGLVLCFIPGNYQEFVTWNVYKDNDERGDNLWHAEAGHYFMSSVEGIIAAATDYQKRGGK